MVTETSKKDTRPRFWFWHIPKTVRKTLDGLPNFAWIAEMTEWAIVNIFLGHLFPFKDRRKQKQYYPYHIVLVDYKMEIGITITFKIVEHNTWRYKYIFLRMIDLANYIFNHLLLLFEICLWFVEILAQFDSFKQISITIKMQQGRFLSVFALGIAWLKKKKYKNSGPILYHQDSWIQYFMYKESHMHWYISHAITTQAS